MKDEQGNRIVPHKRIWHVVIPVVLLLVLLPGILKFIANGIVLPSKFSDAGNPLVSGRINRLGYTGLTAQNLVIDAGGMQLQVPQARIEYTPWLLARKRFKSATAQITSESRIAFETEVAARDVHFSPDGVSAALFAECSYIKSGRFNVGPFTASTQVEGKSASMDFHVPLLDGRLTANVALDADWKTNPVYRAKATIPLGSEDGTAVQLTGLASGVNDLLASGHAEATVSGSSNGTTVGFALDIDTLAWAEHDLSLSNLNTVCTIHFPGPFRSLPEQPLTVDHLSVGKMNFDHLRMHYQLEPGSVLFIESLELDWCDGRVNLYNTRFQPGTTAMEAQLFCDRLSLEQVLSTFGLDNFSAGGELNGRLPLRWDEHGLGIDEGFLFTTPGRGGVFAFDTEKAAASVLPSDSLQGGQLGMVSAALANFKYDWITMTLNSEGEDLKILVEIAGKPVNVLPYEYDAERGTYIKVALRSGRGTRQPMRFNLNLTVPLNRLLCYASGINRQWNLFKAKQ